jgi:hypothetical protein
MKPILTPIQQHNKWGFANSEGQILIPCRFDEVHAFGAIGYATPVREGNAWYFITHNGKRTSDFSYEVVELYYWHRYLVQRDGLWGFVNEFGQEIVGCRYEDVVRTDEESRLVFNMIETPVRFNGKWGLINDKGQLVLPCKYDQIGTVHNGSAEVKIGRKCQKISFQQFPQSQSL